MTDTREMLRGARDRFPPPADFMESLTKRRRGRERARRLQAAALATIVAVAALAVLGRTFLSGEPRPQPADVFKDIRGWITSWDGATILGIDPTGRDTQPVQIASHDGEPLAWSADGSTLLIRRHGTGDLFLLTADGSVTRLTGDERPVNGGSLSPDGTHVVYASGKASGTSAIVLLDVATRARRELVTGGEKDHRLLFVPTFSPDGTKIAFADGDLGETPRIWVMNADGSDPHIVFSGDQVTPELQVPAAVWGPILHLTWSPDGEQLAFDFVTLVDGPTGEKVRLTVGYGGSWIYRGEVPRSDIYVMNADGSDVRLAFPGGSNPRWSPDGSLLAYTDGVTARVPFIGSLLVVPAEGGSPVLEVAGARSGPWNPVAASLSASEAPLPSATGEPSGSFADVAGWITYRDGRSIMAVDPAQADVRVSIAPSGGADPIAWSADGRRLLLRSGIELGVVSFPLDLVLRKADGSSTRLLHVEGGGNWATWGSFSPDGRMVVYGCCGNATGPYLVRADGSRRRAIIDSCETPPSLGGGLGCGEPLEEAAAWAPDGALIAWIDWVEDSATYGHHARVLSLVNADGTRLRAEVRRVNSAGLSLLWSPDGSRLLTWSEGGDILVIDVKSLTQMRLTTDGDNRWPVWSPDGTRIAFVRDGSLFTMAADGTDLQAIEGVEPEGAIAWNPVQ